jgi:hypothetical protein
MRSFDPAMSDLDALKLDPPPKVETRVGGTTPPAEWHSLTWRPAGSMPLGERWLRAGDARGDTVPPKLKRRR